MAKFHFFADIDKILIQPAVAAFGPTQANPDTEYRVTSLHTASTDCNAFAVCDGSVLVQQDSIDPTLVNIILKPKNQGYVDFLNVKYFIYRGIFKSSLIDQADSNKVAPETTNDLTQSVWHTQALLNQSIATSSGNPNTNEEAPSRALGISFSIGGADARPDTDLIDSLFFNNAFNFKPPQVKGGMRIGTFKATGYSGDGFGFEIMVHSLGFKPTLGSVRNNENKITASVLSGSPTQLQIIQNNSAREKILNYIDPCAYYGLHFNSKIVVHDSSGGSAKKSGNEIYDDILSKFYNQDAVYIDIRNENGYSFNYYNNYGDNFNASFDPAAASLTTTGYSTSGWPIKIIRNSDFASGNNSNKNIIRISLPQADNTIPLLYLSHGQEYSRYPRVPKNKKKFIPLTFSSGFTNEVKIASPNRTGSVTASSSWYVKLYYIKRNDVFATPGTTLVVPTKHFHDNLFSPVALPTFWDNTNDIKYIAGLHEKFVDAESTLGFAAMVETGITMEQNRVIHFAYPTDVFISQIKRNDVFKRILGGSSNKASFFDVIKNIFPKLRLTKKKLHLSPDKYYLRYAEDGEGNVKENFLCLCLTMLEHQNIATAVSSTQLDANLHIPFILTKTVVVNTDSINNAFYKVEHGVIGITNAGQKAESSPSSTVYSGDLLVNSSNNAAFAENISEQINDIDLKVNYQDRESFIKRLSIIGLTSNWELYDRNGNQLNYNLGETDYFSQSISNTPILLPAGTRVLILGTKRISIGAYIDYTYIVCWHLGRYREGLVNSLALENSNNGTRVNLDDLNSSSAVVVPFLDDAHHILAYLTGYYAVHSTPNSPNFKNIFDDAKLKLQIILSTQSYLSIQSKIFQLLDNLYRTDNISAGFDNFRTNSLDIPDTIARWYSFTPFKTLIDNYINTITYNNVPFPVKYETLKFSSKWVNDWYQLDTGFKIFLDANSTIKPFFSQLFSSSFTTTDSGTSYRIGESEYTNAVSYLFSISNYLNTQVYNLPINLSAEGNWIRSLPSTEFADKSHIIIIDEGSWDLRNKDRIYAASILSDQSVGYLDSDCPFSIFMEEHNVAFGIANPGLLEISNHISDIGSFEILIKAIQNNLISGNALDFFTNGISNPYVISNNFFSSDLFQHSPTLSLIYLSHYINFIY